MKIMSAVLELLELNQLHMKLLEECRASEASSADASSCSLRSGDEGTVTGSAKPKPVTVVEWMELSS